MISLFLPVIAAAETAADNAPELFPRMEADPQTAWQAFIHDPTAPYLIALFIALLLLGVAVFVWAVRRPKRPDSQDVVLRQRLHGLRKAQLQPDLLYGAVASILRGALAWRYQLPAAVWTQRELRRAVDEMPDSEDAQPALELLAECEQARYSGAVVDATDVLDRADSALNALLSTQPVSSSPKGGSGR